jgi:hypothetical protein
VRLASAGDSYAAKGAADPALSGAMPMATQERPAGTGRTSPSATFGTIKLAGTGPVPAEVS